MQDQAPPTEQDSDTTELKELALQRDEYLEGWKRAKADFINYKKEESERLARVGELAITRVAKDFLSVLDTIEKAERHLPPLSKTDGVREGFALVAKQIRDICSSYEIAEIEALGTLFNPDIHEAVAERCKEGMDPGTVLDVVEKGYTMREKLLRPAKVIVST